MSDLERQLEELFMSDSRARRVDQVNVPVARRSRFGGPAFIGGVAIAVLALIVAFSLLRSGRETSPASSPSASPSSSAAAIATSSASASAAPTPSGSASSAPGAGVVPDTKHGLITFSSIRTEADPTNLQSPLQFQKGPGTGFVVAVSPDGKNVAMIRSGETAQELITFTTARPNDITRIAPSAFLSGQEFAGSIVWAGDGSNSVLVSVHVTPFSTSPDPQSTYSALKAVDLTTNQAREIARITNGRYLQPLAWRPDRRLAAAAETDGSNVGSYDLVREGNPAPERTNITGVFAIGINASRDGLRVVAVAAPAVRWWPMDQPNAAKELIAGSNGRAEYAAFRPGADELGVRVTAASASAGVPPPGHFEIWSLSGEQRIVSTTVGFSFWRADGSAAIDGTVLIDPSSGATTPLPGGAFKIVDVVLF